VGKTRLAGEVARAVAGQFADWAWLAPVGDPAQVPGMVAAALGMREQPGVPVAEAVARVLLNIWVWSKRSIGEDTSFKPC